MEWIFSGIGTQILFSVLSFLIGGVVGYRIGISNKNKQSQTAGKGSTQNMTNTHTLTIGDVNNSIANQANGNVVNTKDVK